MTGDARRPTRRDLAYGAGAFAFLLAAWFPHLLPGAYSIDDYRNLQPGAIDVLLSSSLSQGRFVQALLHAFAWRLGVDPIHSATFVNLLALLLLSGCAVLVIHLWRLDDRPALAILVAALAFSHPFGSDLWSFRQAPISFALAHAGALAGVFALRRRWFGITAPVLFIALSIGIYQTNLNAALIVILMGMLLDSGADGPSRQWLSVLGWVAVSLVAYLSINKLVMLATHSLPQERAGLVSLGELPIRAREVAQQLKRILVGERQLSTGLLALLQALLATAAVIALTITSRQRRSLRPIAVGIPILLMSLGLTVGIVAATRVFWPTPRTLTAAGFFFAGLFAIAARGENPWLRRFALALAGLLWIGWAGIDHRAADEQHRVNARDLLRMSRVAGRLEAQPGFEHMKRIAIVNGPNGYGDIKTITGDLNLSAFVKPWSWAGLLTEAGGVQSVEATAEDWKRAAEHCAGAPKWPAAASASIEGDLGVVCF